jgi:hypothetical protein
VVETYKNDVTISPTVAAKIAAVVIQPKMCGHFESTGSPALTHASNPP